MTRTDLGSRTRFLASLWLRARLLPFRVGQRDLQSVLALAAYDGPPRFAGLDAPYICRHVRRATRFPVLMRKRRCLREGLLGFYFLRAAGFDPELRFGVDGKSLGQKKVKAHCWVCLESRSILNDRHEGMVDILVFPPPTSSDDTARASS